MIHDIRIQAWAAYAVVVCKTCGKDETAGAVLAKSDSTTGITFAEAVAAIEAHTGEGAFRATLGGQPVEGQITVGQRIPNEYGDRAIPEALYPAEEPLVAYGKPDDFGTGYHPRTGQKLEP